MMDCHSLKKSVAPELKRKKEKNLELRKEESSSKIVNIASSVFLKIFVL